MSNEEFIQAMFIKAKSALSQDELQVVIDFYKYDLTYQGSVFQWLLSLPLSDEIKNEIRDYCYIEVARSIIKHKAKQNIKEFKGIVGWLYSQRLSVIDLCLSFAAACETWVDTEDYEDILSNLQVLQELTQYTSEVEPYCGLMFGHIENFVINVMDKEFDIFFLLSLHDVYSGQDYYSKSIDTHIHFVFQELGRKLIAMRDILEYQKLIITYKDTMKRELFTKNHEYEALVYRRVKRIIKKLPKNERKLPAIGMSVQNNKVSVFLLEMEIMMIFNFTKEILSSFKAFSEIVSINAYLISMNGIHFTNVMVELENNCLTVCFSLSYNEFFGKSEMINLLNGLKTFLPDMILDYY